MFSKLGWQKILGDNASRLPDGRTDLKRETDLLAYAVTAHGVGDAVTAKVLRDGRKLTLTLPMQE